MANWIQIGETKFNLDTVTAVHHPQRGNPGMLEVYVAGRSEPFLLHSEEATAMWERIPASDVMGDGPGITSV